MTLNFTSWNQIADWLKRLDSLKAAGNREQHHREAEGEAEGEPKGALVDEVRRAWSKAARH